MEIKVFKDQHINLGYFSHLRYIHCPKCNKKSTIINNEGLKFSCNNCVINLKLEPKYNLCIKYYCLICSKKINTIVIPNLKSNDKNILIDRTNCFKCNNIIKKNDIELTYYEIDDKNIKEYLTSKLWLQSDFRGDIFWAYNYEHLYYLKSFIQANIRKRVEERAFMTMIEKLPKFIKSSKNRTKLLRVIESLEKKL